MSDFVVYEKLIPNLNTKPFNVSEELLSLFDISYEKFPQDKWDIGYEKRFLDKDFYKRFEPILLHAKESNKTILTQENSSHLGLCEAKNKLQIDVQITSTCKILFEHLQKAKIKHNFSNFNAGIYQGDHKLMQNDFISKILHFLKAKEIKLQNTHNCSGFEILDISSEKSKKISNKFISSLFRTFVPSELNQEMAYDMAGDILFEAYDSGCDFLVVNDIRAFYIFDCLQKNIEKKKKRPLGESGMSVFSIYELLLLALGDTKMISTHNIKPDFI